MVPSLTSVISKTSPTRPCSVGPTPSPLNVQRVCHSPGATSRGTSVTRSVSLCSRASVSGGSTGSTVRVSVSAGLAGIASPVPPPMWCVEPPAGAAGWAAAGAPSAMIVSVIPICR